MKKYEIWMADLPAGAYTHVQYGYCPVIIISNDMANRHSPAVTVIPLTTRPKKPLPTHVFITQQGLNKDGTALCEQIMTIDKARCKRCVGFVYDNFARLSLHHAICIQLGMTA